MNSGSSGMTLSWPGATRLAASMVWKYSVSPGLLLPAPRRRSSSGGNGWIFEQMILGAVQGDQQPAAEPAEIVQPAFAPLQGRDRLGEHRMEKLRRRRVQHVADVIVARYLRQPEQGLAVRTPMSCLERR